MTLPDPERGVVEDEAPGAEPEESSPDVEAFVERADEAPVAKLRAVAELAAVPEVAAIPEFEAVAELATEPEPATPGGGEDVLVHPAPKNSAAAPTATDALRPVRGCHMLVRSCRGTRVPDGSPGRVYDVQLS